MTIEFIVVGVCLLFNALLACIEMAFVSVGRPMLRQMAQSGNKDARRLLALRENPERTLSVLQVGITLVGVVSAAVGGAGAEENLSPIFQNGFGFSEPLAEALSIIVVVVPITFLSVVLGELVPKTLALRRPLTIALISSRWLALADSLLAPIVGVLEWSTKWVFRIFFSGVHHEKSQDGDNAVELGSLSDQHRQYVVNLVQLEKKQVRDVMVPWKQVFTIDYNMNLPTAQAAILSAGHSRIPVLDGSELKGFLYVKDLMNFQASGYDNWISIMRPVIVVRERDTLLRVLRMMQEKRNHISFVYSEQKMLIGIVSFEDIIEEVVGEIYDEDDDGKLRHILASSSKTRLSQLRKNPGALFQLPLENPPKS